MRSFGSIVGVLILFANLACASLCALPQPAAPPCHQHHQDDGAQTKPCDHNSWTGDTFKFTVEPVLALTPASVLVPLHVLPPGVALRRPDLSPPLILRI